MEVRIKPLGLVMLFVLIALGGVSLWNLRKQVVPSAEPIPTPQTIASPAATEGASTSPEEIPAFSTTAAYGTIKANDPAIKKAISALDLKKAADFIDSQATFTGTVTKVFIPKGGTVRILNFADDYKTAISGLIEAKDFGKVPDPETLVGKQVVITGSVLEFQGRAEVQITEPTHIKVITK